MVDLSSVSSKKQSDSRNNWVTMMFVCKGRYNCFGKQSHIDVCTEAFKEFERLGFLFDEIGFGGNHVHFLVDIPKRYSIESAEEMLKQRSAERIFEEHPGFHKRYPHNHFWSGYEHHQSSGIQDINAARKYIRDQEAHHHVDVINDTTNQSS